MRSYIALLFLVAAVTVSAAEKAVLRVGYFPNVTHAQGVIGRTLSHEQKGWFEARLGPDVEVQWFVYNAGPSAMEAIFAGSIDLTYVGPSPALNAFFRTGGKEIRAIAGAAQGGAALVVRPEAGLKKPEDFRGRRIATPQLGNTQDVAARAWFRQHGYKITQLAGEVAVLPTSNPDQLALFQAGKIDGAWTVEPWVSRLEREAGGVVYLEQPDVVTTLLVSSVKALEEKRALVVAFAQAHRELTEWIQAHPEEAQRLVQRGLSEEVRREIPLDLIQATWKRLTFTSTLTLNSIESMAEDARALGFLRGRADLAKLITPLP